MLQAEPRRTGDEEPAIELPSDGGKPPPEPERMDGKLTSVAKSVQPLLEAGLKRLRALTDRVRLPVPGGTPAWDPVQRTTFIEWFPKWSGNVGTLKAVLDAADDAPLRSGISLALGSLTEVSAETKQAWEPVLANWHTRHPDSGVHSAAGWALRSWGLSPPTIESQG